MEADGEICGRSSAQIRVAGRARSWFDGTTATVEVTKFSISFISRAFIQPIRCRVGASRSPSCDWTEIECQSHLGCQLVLLPSATHNLYRWSAIHHFVHLQDCSHWTVGPTRGENGRDCRGFVATIRSVLAWCPVECWVGWLWMVTDYWVVCRRLGVRWSMQRKDRRETMERTVDDRFAIIVATTAVMVSSIATVSSNMRDHGAIGTCCGGSAGANQLSSVDLCLVLMTRRTTDVINPPGNCE